MKATISRTATESKKFHYFSSFRDSKRVKWAENRSFMR